MKSENTLNCDKCDWSTLVEPTSTWRKSVKQVAAEAEYRLKRHIVQEHTIKGKLTSFLYRLVPRGDVTLSKFWAWALGLALAASLLGNLYQSDANTKQKNEFDAVNAEETSYQALAKSNGSDLAAAQSALNKAQADLQTAERIANQNDRQNFCYLSNLHPASGETELLYDRPYLVCLSSPGPGLNWANILP